MERRGSWQQTFTSRQVWPLDMRVEDIDIRDLAHALALQCRYAGHCRVPYSVAEHSVRVMHAVELDGAHAPAEVQRLRLAALLHDAPEAYLTDLPRPLKLTPEMAPYREAEERCAEVIERWAGLPRGAFEWPAVKYADAVLLMTEKRDLLGPAPAPWGQSQGRQVPPLDGHIAPWTWRRAEAAYLQAFLGLTREQAIHVEADHG